MTKKEFLNKVANNKKDVFQILLDTLKEKDIRFCVIGGLAVNAYCEPVVSLDLDIIIIAERIPELVKLLAKQFSISEQPHSINLSSPDSDLRIQIKTDPRYQKFIKRAVDKNVLGYDIPVASMEDILQGKIWAYEDLARRPSKRQKDLADIMRLVETHPKLVSKLPDIIKKRVISDK
jgi:hypothetical protein